jgi:cytochrome c-type biogenesis protein CcmH|tara:strand:- start:9335 stop:10552 length:1218 start_codon:yes stop_codon:yes gene_type:complete
MIMTIVLLLLVASVFVLYPFIIGQSDGAESVTLSRKQANIRLFKEQQLQFQQQFDRAEIDQTECQRLIDDAKQLLLRNTTADTAEPSALTAQGLWLIPGIVLIMSAVTFFAYQQLGAEDDEYIQSLMNSGGDKPEALWTTALIEAVEDRVQDRPDNVYYWVILAQSSIAKGDILAASNYFASALKVEPLDTFLLAQYAETLFIVDKSQFTERVATAIDRAFTADSSNETVLGLKGIQAFEERQFDLAVTYWEAARRGMDPAGATWQALQSGIDRANDIRGMQEESESQPSIMAQVQLDVSLSPTIAFSSDQLVFVAAVRETGSPMPLAARKLRAAEMPMTVVLSDKDALMAGQGLSSASRIRLIARLSVSGSATPQSGDWEAVSEAFDLSSQAGAIKLNISRQRP